MDCQKKLFFAGLALILFISIQGRAETIFEGYSKIILSNTHVGYIVQRYEFLPKKKQFTSTYFVKTNAAGGNITESLQARSTQTLKPLSYQFTRKDSTGVITIDAKFNKEVMTAAVTSNGKSSKIQRKLEKGTFLSTFLLYLMLQNKNGLKPGMKYNYQAVAEEDGTLSKGEAYVASEQNYKGQGSLKVLNTFKNAKFISYVNHQGEVLATSSPAQAISTELVVSATEATQNVAFPKKTLEMLFGNIPEGKNSLVVPTQKKDSNK